MGGEDKSQKKDAWDKWAIVLTPVGGLFTALAIAFFTYYTNQRLEKSQESDNRTRLYTELIGKREEAETNLRKEMFTSILDAFLKSQPEGSAPLEPEVLKLELLAYNFHESFDLAPLFKNLERRLEDDIKAGHNPKECLSYLKRLRKVATDINARQLAALVESGGSFNCDLQFQLPLEEQAFAQSLTVGGIKRDIKVFVETNDVTTQELYVHLLISTPKADGAGGQSQEKETTDAHFWVGSFEFPMIDNTRLSGDQRCAVVLQDYDMDPPGNAQLTVVCFQGSRAALNEKPYYDEILDKLRPAE